MKSISNALRSFYYYLSPARRKLLRRWFFFPVDFWEYIVGARKPLVPPKGMIFVGRGDFEKVGDSLLALMQSTCPIKPHYHVLDVGCGIGRLARPLTNFLDSNGSYSGFDVEEEGISWCKTHYKHFPNFHFDHVPLYNDLYNNNQALQKPEEFNFPYAQEKFDLVILTSVFTHMMPDAFEQYVSEISRVLKPGGTCFATAYIVDDDIEKNHHKKLYQFFPYSHGRVYLHNLLVPSANVAYPFDYFQSVFAQSGLRLCTMKRGWWFKHAASDGEHFQDTLIFQKPESVQS